MTKIEVLNVCSRARTRAEVDAAWKVRDAFLARCPDDRDVIDAGGCLLRLQEALELAQVEPLIASAHR